jgi:hypothetical protein
MKALTVLSNASIARDKSKKTAKGILVLGLLFFLCSVSLEAPAQSQTWGPWHRLDTDYVVHSVIEVSFGHVTESTICWKFRNGDVYNTIKSFEFTYTYTDADTGQQKTDKDVMPTTLKPGEQFGGWAAFTANTRSEPKIKITSIQYQ